MDANQSHDDSRVQTSIPVQKPAPAKPVSHWKNLFLRLYCRLMVAFYLCLIYALSIGPIYWDWYDSEHGVESKLLAVTYRPLIWACQFEPLGKLMQWYLDFWI